MIRFNNLLKKGTTENCAGNCNRIMKYFRTCRRFYNFSSLKSFSSNELSSNFSSNLNFRRFSLNFEMKMKKSEEVFESLSNKYEKFYNSKRNSNLISHLTKKFSIDNRENQIFYRLENLYSDLNKNSKIKPTLSQLNNESNFPQLRELRENLINTKNPTILKEIINPLYKTILDNLDLSENKLSLLEDSLHITNFVANYYFSLETSNVLNYPFIKESLIGHLTILNKVDPISLSIEFFKQNENFLFYIIENWLKVEDLSESESRLTQDLSSNLLKSLDRFGDVIIKYSGDKSPEMFNLYFLYAYHYFNRHFPDYLKAEEYIDKAATILKSNEELNNLQKDIRYIQVNYILAEIQLKHRKNLKESFLQLEEAINILDTFSTTPQKTLNSEVLEIIKIKLLEEYSRLLLISKEKVYKVIEISDDLKNNETIRVELLKKHPSSFISYIDHFKTLGLFLQTEGFSRKSYDYFKYIYNLKREQNSEREMEIDSIALLFEDSADHYFTSGSFSKSFNKNQISLDSLEYFNLYLSNLFQDSLNPSIHNLIERIQFANLLKSIIDHIQKFKSENGIKFENEEKFILNHIISTIRLNILSAEFERAAENLNKAIEIVNKTENSQNLECLINLNINLYFALSMFDIKNNRTIDILLNLKKILKKYFESSKNLESIDLLIEANFDLYELYFEENKVNEAIDCMIDASHVNKQIEKIDYTKYKFYSEKLKKIRDHIKSLKEKVEKEANEENETRQIHQEKQYESQQNKKIVMGFFAKSEIS